MSRIVLFWLCPSFVRSSSEGLFSSRSFVDSVLLGFGFFWGLVLFLGFVRGLFLLLLVIRVLAFCLFLLLLWFDWVLLSVLLLMFVCACV